MIQKEVAEAIDTFTTAAIKANLKLDSAQEIRNHTDQIFLGIFELIRKCSSKKVAKSLETNPWRFIWEMTSTEKSDRGTLSSELIKVK